LEEEGAEWLGVALIEEGIQLRAAGVRIPILVLSGSYDGGYQALLEYKLVPAIFRDEHLTGLAKALRRGEKVSVHLKVDTGMGRLGVWPSELPDFIQRIKSYPSIEVDGILSHFANADLADADVTARQVQTFEEALAQLRAAGVNPRWRHLSNSAGILLRSDIRALGINLARPGIGLYGINPTSSEVPAKLAPVLAWKTEIIHLKRVPKGTAISYGGTWKAPKETAVATLPVGYADGYFRTNSNKAEVLVRGQRAPIIGRVCMDLCMVDVTHIEGARVGDEVVLLGLQGQEEIPASELAGYTNTIPYEIVCGISARVARSSRSTVR
jgi:alanine racemase